MILKTAHYLVYMILNGKGVLMGTVLFPFFFNRSIQYSSFFKQNICALVSSVLFACLCILQFSNRGEVEDYIKCELIDGGSPSHLDFLIC